MEKCTVKQINEHVWLLRDGCKTPAILWRAVRRRF